MQRIWVYKEGALFCTWMNGLFQGAWPKVLGLSLNMITEQGVQILAGPIPEDLKFQEEIAVLCSSNSTNFHPEKQPILLGAVCNHVKIYQF